MKNLVGTFITFCGYPCITLQVSRKTTKYEKVYVMYSKIHQYFSSLKRNIHYKFGFQG